MNSNSIYSKRRNQLDIFFDDFDVFFKCMYSFLYELFHANSAKQLCLRISRHANLIYSFHIDKEKKKKSLLKASLSPSNEVQKNRIPAVTL